MSPVARLPEAVKMDHPTRKQITQINRYVELAYVRFGSKADMCNAKGHVRFTPNSDRESGHSRRLHHPTLVGPACTLP
jgi:hypothetical protein